MTLPFFSQNKSFPHFTPIYDDDRVISIKTGKAFTCFSCKLIYHPDKHEFLYGPTFLFPNINSFTLTTLSASITKASINFFCQCQVGTSFLLPCSFPLLQTLIQNARTPVGCKKLHIRSTNNSSIKRTLG